MSTLIPINSNYPVLFPVVPVRINARTLSQECVELLRRVTPEERASIDEKLSSLTKIEPNIKRLYDALESQNWNDEIFTDENVPYYALEAVGLEEGHPHKLNIGQFATLMSFWRACQDIEDLEPIALFDDQGQINPKAEKYLRESMRENGVGPYLTDSQIHQLFDEMAKLPKSEQQFFLSSYAVSYDKDYVLSRVGEVGIHLFSLTEKRRRFVPSFGLMQTFLRVKFGPDAVDMKPVLGLSSQDDIRNNGLNGERDMAIHFPGIFLPDMADGYKAPGFDFTYHDFYHAFVSSAAPQKIRSLFIHIADLILQFKSSANQVDKIDIASLADKFIDLDLNSFVPERREENYTINDLFWTWINSLFSKQAIEKDLSQKILMAIIEQLPLIPETMEGPKKAFEKINQKLDFLINKYTVEKLTTDLTLMQIRKEACPLKLILPIWERRIDQATNLEGA